MSTPTVRTDREPIAKRFPRLGDFTAVHGRGSLGTDTGGAPEPTDVFIRALVTLPRHRSRDRSAFPIATRAIGLGREAER